VKNDNIANDYKLDTNECNPGHPLRLLLDMKNVRDILMLCIGCRADFVRAQIWLVFLANFCKYFILMASQAFLFQFVEKVYDWDSKTFSQYQSLSYIINSISVMLLTTVLIKVRILSAFVIITNIMPKKSFLRN